MTETNSTKKTAVNKEYSFIKKLNHKKYIVQIINNNFNYTVIVGQGNTQKTFFNYKQINLHGLQIQLASCIKVDGW
ncbi:hypothetical protein AS361_08025 [Myroides marinus]|nr:hypothetical protein AS361_08025 [Myroides marinus]